MHQDMTLVDEDYFSGINIWCPMVDLNETNGAIEILPKSHRFYKTYRGSSIPDIYDNVKDEVRGLMEPCYLKAGEAIIFDQSIIHNSPQIYQIQNAQLSIRLLRIQIRKLRFVIGIRKIMGMRSKYSNKKMTSSQSLRISDTIFSIDRI